MCIRDRLKVITTGAGLNGAYALNIDVDASSDYTFSVWVKAPMGNTVRMWLDERTAEDVRVGYAEKNNTATGSWQKIFVHRTFGATGVKARLYLFSSAQAMTFYADGWQLEKKIAPTSTCIGDMGEGYDWGNGAHASTSSRTASYVLLDDYINLVSDNNTLSFRCVVQMPYDADATWPTVYSFLYEMQGADVNNRIFLMYNIDGANTNFSVYINGGWRIDSPAQTFKAGDWLDILLTLDFVANDYNLYIDADLEGTNTTALAAPTLTDWVLGDRYTHTGVNVGGFAFAEYAVFDRVLTAVEVAQLYNLQRPLIDTGGTDKPGIYILDGMFRILSQQTGNRIEITPDEIAGYDGAGTKQFYLQSSDGKAMAGGGVVVLDEDGIDVAITTAVADVRAYKFNLSGTVMSGLWAYAADANSHVINLQANSIASRSPTIGIYSNAPATTPAYISIKALSGAGDYAQILLTADSDAAVKKQMDFYADKFNFGIAAVPAAVLSTDGYIPLYFNGVLRKVFYGSFA